MQKSFVTAATLDHMGEITYDKEHTKKAIASFQPLHPSRLEQGWHWVKVAQESGPLSRQPRLAHSFLGPKPHLTGVPELWAWGTLTHAPILRVSTRCQFTGSLPAGLRDQGVCFL